MPTTKFRSSAARASLAVAACGGTLLFAAGPASAASSGITTPTPGQTFTVPECTTTTNCDNIYANSGSGPANANDVGAPVAFNVAGTGFSQGQTVYIEICDGKSPTSSGYSVTADCDSATSPAGRLISANNPNGNVSWGTGPANAASYQEIGVFRGESPSDLFNCLAPHDNPKSTATQDGEAIDPSRPSYTNCQLRMDTSLTAQSTPTYVTLAIPDAPSPVTATPEAPVAILLPVGAAALLAGGFFLTRRRRSHRAAA